MPQKFTAFLLRRVDNVLVGLSVALWKFRVLAYLGDLKTQYMTFCELGSHLIRYIAVYLNNKTHTLNPEWNATQVPYLSGNGCTSTKLGWTLLLLELNSGSDPT